MKEIKLKGYNSNFKGTKTNPVTEIQKSIFKAIEKALDIKYDPDNYTSYSAWQIISKYQDRITLRYYTENRNEFPTICIDGVEVYKKPETKPVHPDKKYTFEPIKCVRVDDDDIEF